MNQVAGVRRASSPLQPRRRCLAWAVGGVGLVALSGGAAAYFWQAQRARSVPLIEAEVCVVSPPVPYDASSGVSALAPRAVPVTARCPVCGMFPARHAAWAAQVHYHSNEAHFFDSPVDLLQFLADVGRYSAGRRLADVRARWVTDFPGGQWVSLEQAWFVLDSQVLGPMRRGDLPAFADEAGARRFAVLNGGTALRYADVTPDILKQLSIERGHGLHDAQAHA